MKSAQTHPVAVLQALLVTFLWSTSWVLIKLGLGEIPALSFAGLRYFIAFLMLLGVFLSRADLHRQLGRLKPRQWLQLSLLGVVFYGLTQGAQFVALEQLPAVTLSLILAFSPALVGLLGSWFLGERLSRRQWVGVGGFLLGAVVYFLPVLGTLDGTDSSISRIGLAVGMLCLVANAGGALLGRSVNRGGELHPLLVTVVSMGIGSVLLLVTGLASDGLPRLSVSGWSIVLWLAVVNTAFAFTLWNHTLRRLTAVQSSLINNTMLLQVAVLAWIFLGESITVVEGVGLLLAMLGVLLVQLPARRSKLKRA